MISEAAKPLALQAILYFTIAKLNGATRLEAITAFCGSKLSMAFGPNLTVANVYGLAEAGGYQK